MNVDIVFDSKGRWGLCIGVDPPAGSRFKRYNLDVDEIHGFPVCIHNAYRLVSEYARHRKKWEEVQIPDSLLF